jgi:predicted aspartyl protease
VIQGVVNARHEAIVRLKVRGRGGEVDIDAILGSGFTAALALPLKMVADLGLVRQSGGTAVLADGTVRQFDLFIADVEWEGAWRPVLVSGVGNEALIGMRLLAGSKLTVEVVPGGLVQIEAMS